jgi:serine/threonine protein kinase
MNDVAATQCAHCAAPLVQVCARCGSPRPWYVPRCAQCAAQADDAALFTNLFRRAPNRELHGRYVLQEVLRSGEISTVYRARDRQDPAASYAIKELASVALFRAEERRLAEQQLAQALEHWRTLQHPALPRLVDHFAEQGNQYIVMEYVEGWSMAQLIAERRTRVTPDQARSWGAQLCQLFSYLHAQVPPLHVPFLAPQHVLVTPRGEVKLVDWGLTYLYAPQRMGAYGSARGYAAPELESGAPTVQSDLFALGRLLYALLVGRLLEKGGGQPLPLRKAVPGISDQLVKVIARAAHRDAAQRFASAAEMLEALGEVDPVPPTLASSAPLPYPMLSAQPTSATVGQSMAELGFVRDARYGPLEQEVSAPEPPTGKARLIVRPRQVELRDLKAVDRKRLVLQVQNAGERELAGRVISHVPWIRTPSALLNLAPGKSAKVIISILPGEMSGPTVNEAQAISIDSNVGQQWIGASVQIATSPQLHVEPLALDFGQVEAEAQPAQTLAISNSGQQILSGQVASSVGWLEVPRRDFRCAAGQTARVTVRLLPEQLPRGRQDVADALVVDSDGGQERIRVLAQRIQPELDPGVTHLDVGALFAGQTTEHLLVVGNAGDGSLRGTAISLLPYLAVEPSHFTCPAGQMVQLTLTLHTGDLEDGLLNAPQALRLQTNGGNATLSLRAQVQAPRVHLVSTSLEYGTVPWGDSRSLPLVLRNAGSAPARIALQSAVEWLLLSDTTVECAPGQSITVTVTADTGRFARGEDVHLSEAVIVVTPRETIRLTAHLEVLKPAMLIEPGAVDFGYVELSAPEERVLTLTNEGTGQLAWNAVHDAAWLEVTPHQGMCQSGERQSIILRAYGLALETGAEEAGATLVINSDGGRAKIPARMALAAPRIATDVTYLDLGVSVNLATVTGSFRIFNHGLGMLRGSISTSQTWLVVERASFECGMGRSIEVRVQTDMDEFPIGATFSAGLIQVRSNGGDVDVEVMANVSLEPQVQVGSELLQLERKATDLPYQGRLVLRNVGKATGHVELTSSDPRLELARSSCDIKADKSVRLAVLWQGEAISGGDSVYVEIACAKQRLRMPVAWVI